MLVVWWPRWLQGNVEDRYKSKLHYATVIFVFPQEYPTICHPTRWPGERSATWLRFYRPKHCTIFSANLPCALAWDMFQGYWHLIGCIHQPLSEWEFRLTIAPYVSALMRPPKVDSWSAKGGSSREKNRWCCYWTCKGLKSSQPMALYYIHHHFQ